MPQPASADFEAMLDKLSPERRELYLRFRELCEKIGSTFDVVRAVREVRNGDEEGASIDSRTGSLQ